VSNYNPTSSHLFFSKNDPDDLRLGDLFKTSDSSKSHDPHSYCLLGYPDDEGIKLNGGRIGAEAAPQMIREFLYKMTPQFSPNKFFDLGDLKTDVSLPERHSIAQNDICNLHKQNLRTISLGGGHDYGYSDASGFLKAHLGKDVKPVVLNFDAHLDVRPTTKGFNSGTPFYRLLSEFEGQFEFAEIGIQPQCNSIKHRDWALNKKAHIFNLKDIQNNNGLTSILAHPLFSKLTCNTPLFISFDIDCLTSSEAPGCSQSWVTGLKTEDYLKFFLRLAKLADIRGLGIYEVSPKLDSDNRTSKVAALISYNYLFQDSL
jgi:formiminoglutamase